MIRTTFYPNGFHLCCKVTSRDTLEDIAREMHEQALRSARFSFAHQTGNWSVLNTEPTQKERPDFIRTRIAQLDSRQRRLESTLKICLCAGLAIGLGALAYQNQASIQGAWQKIPPMADLQQRFWTRWDQFKGLFGIT